MKRVISLMVATALALTGLVSVPAHAQSRSDQSDARKEMQAGNQLSLRQIEARVLPQMRDAEYLGPAYDSTARAYRLKFIKNGRVTFVDVDARTGRIINRSR
ncbi:PepSY domain-containing protein [Altererythrobacter sp. GH1-8]|uniref:PepSY domain-containing protein n=1 Tax=Altererythrobacter sp. GH1-8 TaxID=3349333 RepID=UPI00374DE18B